MRELTDVDLALDPAARAVAKSEVVSVEFATDDGVLQSRVGPNHYAAGDALITGSDGDRWSVRRAIFDTKYGPEPGTVAGEPGRYRNRPSTVLARRFDEPFSIRRTSGDLLVGRAGDWLLQYAKGDYGLASAERFAAVYRPV